MASRRYQRFEMQRHGVLAPADFGRADPAGALATEVYYPSLRESVS